MYKYQSSIVCYIHYNVTRILAVCNAANVYVDNKSINVSFYI